MPPAAGTAERIALRLAGGIERGTRPVGGSGLAPTGVRSTVPTARYLQAKRDHTAHPRGLAAA
jgi:hypothetical protein